MGQSTSLRLDEAFERIEESILPSISLMLDTMLDAAALARPGADADAYSAELRMLVVQLEELTRQVEALTTAQIAAQPASAA